MKRNEMLESIKYILKDTEEMNLEDIAESILEMQEEVGMLPPTTFCGHIGVQDNSWEKE